MTVAPSNPDSDALFRSEYEQELEDWLRRRFRQVCMLYIVLGAAVTMWRLLAAPRGDGAATAYAGTLLAINLGAGALSLATAAYFLFGWPWRGATRDQLLRAASRMILLLGAISLLKAALTLRFTPAESDFILPLFAWHLIACLFLPWTPRESLRPVIPLLVLWAVGVILLSQTPLYERVLRVIFAPAVLLPGLGICALRLRTHSEDFRTRMFGKHFLSLRRELVEARGIHESLFPTPYDDSYLRFDYAYVPMRDLGGDFIHLAVSPEGLLHLTVLDVTGHGLAAALTVNRLYGEIERIRGESPTAGPAEVLRLLNRYINLTMVRHSIYVTGLCATIDPYLGRAMWANAGHPPALMRGANGVVTKLTASAPLLGALDADEFKIQEQAIALAPGDVLVIYTDGVYEARDRTGRALGLRAVDDLMHIQPAPRRWPQFIAAAVQRHHAGRSEDDVLVASVTYLAQRAGDRRTETSATAAAPH